VTGSAGPGAATAPEAPERGSTPGRAQRLRLGGRHASNRAWAPWAGVALAAVLVWTFLTWPFALHLGDLWSLTGNRTTAGQLHFGTRDGALTSSDSLQNVVVDSVVIDNLRALREPYLDLREGAAGPSPLRTTSLNVPWTPVIALLWPLLGLVTAYNLTLLLSTVAAALAAFGWLRRHTRWPLLAAAGALVYAASPHRIYQLSVHFNAVMWWAFPAAAWAWEATLAARREGRPWGRPAAVLAAVVLVVGVSGEYHLALYMAGLVSFLVFWEVVRAWLARRPAPLGPASVGIGAVALANAYVVWVFGYVFRGTVDGGNGGWEEVERYAPRSLASLIGKDFGEAGEGLVYVGVALLALAVAGLVVTVVRRGPALPWAALSLPLLVLTFGPTIRVGSFRPYRLAFDHIPFLTLQRVPQRLMVVTALALVLLAVVGAEWLAAPFVGAGRRRLAAVALVAVTVVLLADYRVSDSRISPSLTGNAVVRALSAAGDRAGPIVGAPVVGKTTTWNSATTFVATLARRRALNAYNQTPAPWLDERLERLAPLGRGQADPGALQVLRETGTRQLVVIDEPHVYGAGGARAVADGLLASGQFRLVTSDGPLVLLELRDLGG
jgi:hypothetical protein